ncbi:MAG: HU family DNA-binding protein [candidate division KSB1 bacterium]|nr:HU family DNA-binding protein [candidate division KSB1 bacterium]
MSEKSRPQLSSGPSKMYSGQLVDRLVNSGGAEPGLMRDFLKATLSLIEEGLLRDGLVRIHNFGTFRLRWTQQRQGINPRTGEKMIVSGRARVIFQPAKNLRELVNLNYQPSLPASVTEPTATVARSLEKPLPTDTRPTEPMRPTIVGDHSVPQEIEAGELLPEPAEPQAPTFVFADPEAEETAEATATFSRTPYERERLKNSERRKRSRGFVWFAGTLVLLLLLLLFLFADRISEMTTPTAPPVASTTPPSPSANQAASPANGQTKLANGEAKASTVTTPFFAGGTHRVAAGDNLWDLSGKYYRDHYLWPNIYRVNNATVSNPDILQIAQQLEMPVLYGPPEQLTPTDRRNLAEGYYLLYRYYKKAESHLAPYALWAAVQYDKRIKTDYLAELRQDDLAFLEAHGIRGAVVER